MGFNRTVYVVSPFRLQECLKSWKAFYAMELFSAFALSGRRVVWIQPGKRCSFTIFPHFNKVWRFTVVELGNFFLFRYLTSLFISRLTKVTREENPLVFFELVDGTPLNLEVNESMLVFPVLFRLDRKWGVYDVTPTPLFVVENDNLNFLMGGSQVVCLPWGYWSGLKEPCKRWDFEMWGREDVKRRLWIVYKDSKGMGERILKEKIANKSLGEKSTFEEYIELEDFSLVEKILVSDFFECLAEKGSGCKVVLERGLSFFIFQLLYFGFRVVCVKDDLIDLGFCFEKNSGYKCFSESRKELVFTDEEKSEEVVLFCEDRSIFEGSGKKEVILSWPEIVNKIIEPVVIPFVKNNF